MLGGRREGAGRPPFVPTAEQRAFVSVGIAAGFRIDDVSRALKMDTKTLRKHFAEEIGTAKAERNINVVAALYQSAIDGNVTAQIYWTKTQLGWKESQHVELTGKDGGAITYEEKLLQLDKSVPSA